MVVHHLRHDVSDHVLRLVEITSEDGTFDSKTEAQNAVKNHSSLVSLLSCIRSEVNVADCDVGEPASLKKPVLYLFVLIVDCSGDIDGMICKLSSNG